MKLTDIFIRRPVLATVVNLFILLAGFLAIKGLNVRQYPEVKNAVVTVMTAYPGASAELVQGFVTTPLEREIASADGIDFVSSSSGPSVSTITARLRLNYNPNDALTQITSKVNRVRGDLPEAAEVPVIDVEMGDSFAAMYMSFSSAAMDSNQITDYLVRVVQPKLAAIPGVQKAEIMGARTFAMRVWIKPDKLAAVGMTPSMLRERLAAQNSLSAVGKTKGALLTVTLNARTDMRSEAEFRDMVIKEEGGKVVRLRDVADVELGAESYDSFVKMGSDNATFLALSVLPTANVLDVVRDVKKIFPQIQAELPSGVNGVIAYDSTEYINDSINEVAKTLIEAMLIVVLVIYLFLGSVRSVIIPLVAIPLSLIGGVFLMMVMGFTINLLTLLAMVIAIGVVVDDAIVVLENIHRHIEEGLSPMDAAIKGAGELVGPIISMTITLAAVYAPMGFQGGVTGALFREFAFTLAGSVLISGVVALTLSPMMCSRILKHEKGGMAEKIDKFFDALHNKYHEFLHMALENRRSLYIIAGVVLLAIVPFYAMGQKELSPTEDLGFMMAIGSAAPNASIEHLQHYSTRIVDELAKEEATKQIFGAGGVMGANSTFFGWVLKPWKDRHQTSMLLVDKMADTLRRSPGLKGGAFIPPSLPGSGNGLPVQFVVGSIDGPERVAEVANTILAKAMETKKFYFGDTDLKFDQPQTDIMIDREKAARLGISMQQLGADLGTLLGGAFVNRFSIEGRGYKVVPQVSRSWRLTPEQLGSYYIATRSGKLVPMSAIVSLKDSVQPQALKRFQQLNAATVSLLPANGVSLGDARAILDKIAKETFPNGYTADYNGELRQYVKEGSTLLATFALAVLVIYLVLSAQYESFRDPLIILMTVPLAMAGALVFVFLGVTTINIYTQVGLITLVGLISKHGIMIVEFANALRAQGKTKREAIEEAAAVRLRPILMTAVSTVAGVIPLLFAHGPGAVSRFSIGVIITAGMTIGTCFTLFVVPAFYMLISKDKYTAIIDAPAENK